MTTLRLKPKQKHMDIVINSILSPRHLLYTFLDIPQTILSILPYIGIGPSNNYIIKNRVFQSHLYDRQLTYIQLEELIHRYVPFECQPKRFLNITTIDELITAINAKNLVYNNGIPVDFSDIDGIIIKIKNMIKKMVMRNRYDINDQFEIPADYATLCNDINSDDIHICVYNWIRNRDLCK